MLVIQIKIQSSNVCNYFISKDLSGNELHFYVWEILKVHHSHLEAGKRAIVM